MNKGSIKQGRNKLMDVVFRNQGDLLAEMEYSIHNYIFFSV